MSETILKLPSLLPHQKTAWKQLKKHTILCCGRRWSKSVFAFNWILEALFDGHDCGWFAPTYKTLDSTIRLAERLLGGVCKINHSQKYVEFPNGKRLEFWSLKNNLDAGRSRKYKRIVIDEAAMVPELERFYHESALPTLADLDGESLLCSTPKGLNDFYRLFKDFEKRDDCAAIQQPTSVNPKISKSFLDEMKARMPERVHSQEILALFIDFGGSCFKNIWASKDEDRPSLAKGDGSSYIVAVDVGRVNDATAIVVMDLRKDGCFIVRAEALYDISFEAQAQRIAEVARDFGSSWLHPESNIMVTSPATVIVERNNAGISLIELIEKKGLYVASHDTTGQNKKPMVDLLTLAFENWQVSIPNDADWLIEEAASFTGKMTPSGHMTYGGVGCHDDGIMATLIGNYYRSQLASDQWIGGY